jgi:hypothetical protein
MTPDPTCGCPVEERLIQIVTHTHACSVRQAAEQISRDLAEQYGSTDAESEGCGHPWRIESSAFAAGVRTCNTCGM